MFNITDIMFLLLAAIAVEEEHEKKGFCCCWGRMGVMVFDSDLDFVG